MRKFLTFLMGFSLLLPSPKYTYIGPSSLSGFPILEKQRISSFAFSIGIGYLLSILSITTVFASSKGSAFFKKGSKRIPNVPVNRISFTYFFSVFSTGGTIAPSIISRSQCLEIDFVYSSNSLTMFFFSSKKVVNSSFLSSKIQTLGSSVIEYLTFPYNRNNILHLILPFYITHKNYTALDVNCHGIVG